MIYQGSARYPVREVMLHCAAIPTGYFLGQTPFQVFSKINEWHLEGARGRPAFKNGFGYHGLITSDGQFFGGRPLSMIGAGCIGKNQGVIHLLLIERVKIALPKGYTLDDCRFEQWYTQAQADQVRTFVGALHGIDRVSGHNDYAARLCPGFKVQSSDWLPKARAA